MTLGDRIGVLDQGRLLQIGAPREIYGRPASIEVARRLGSPPINLVSPGLLPELPVPAATARLGVRPEDVIIDGHGAPATIEQVEHLGAETVVLLTVGDEKLHALVSGESRLDPGAATHVTVAPSAVLFFDGHGHRLDHGREAS
jgi:ABC-type sugar transport system ATPase subunit